ncbi:MAG: Ppx/GppA family phosphatase [Candidatus Sericytochromatia bacterium]|nr:Ppx/GppA family phosphatase [Candidatus Sericytochromatia bacterium]
MFGAPHTHVAVIDLGSNSVRAVIYRVDAHGGVREVENVKRALRLGARLDEGGRLREDARAELLACLRQFRGLMAAWEVSRVTPVATAVFRQAVDGREVLAAGEQALGHPIHLLPGEEEARYGVVGVLETTDFEDALVVDLGGASVELTAVRGRRTEAAVSLPFGAVTLTERFLRGGEERAGCEALKAFLAGALAGHPWVAEVKGPVIAVGGSARSIGRVHLGRRLAGLVGLHQHRVPAADVARMAAEVLALPAGGRTEALELSRERAELLPAALAVFDAALAPGRDALVICGAGLREGVLFEQLRASRGAPRPDTLTVKAAERLLLGFGGDLPHARHVARLAVQLLDGVRATGLPLGGPSSRRVLEAAALLRGLGQVMGVQGFEAFTFPMVLRSGLAGLSAENRARTALVASFKTGKLLKASLGELKPLLQASQAGELEALGGLLLLAEALDRTRRQAVREIAVAPADEGLRLLLRTVEPHPLELTLVDEPLQRLGKTIRRPLMIQAASELELNA